MPKADRKVLIVFGSSSDEHVYLPIAQGLKSHGIAYDLRICSAHRTPDILDSILKQKYDLVIAGAGLAAHLPGVVSSKTICPVIGVPCSGAFEGLDAFLSIVQMPPGYPVLSTGVNNDPFAFAAMILANDGAINIIAPRSGSFSSRLEACQATLKELGAEYVVGKKAQKDAVNINFFELAGEPGYDPLRGKGHGLVINVPIREKTLYDDASRFCEETEDCLCVGVGRAENAAIAAVQAADRGLGRYGQYSKALLAYRQKARQKVIDDDSKISSY